MTDCSLSDRPILARGAPMPILCDVPGCGEAASHKIAAPWKGGGFSELKTYGFACPDHVRDVLGDAEARWLDYEPVRDEVVGYLAIFRFEPGVGDRRLVRDYEMEEDLAAE
jgi:hypothetical protein